MKLVLQLRLQLRFKTRALKKCPKFKLVDEHICEYNHKDGTITRIDLQNKDCSCPGVLDRVVCAHLIVSAILSNVNHIGLTVEKRLIVRYVRNKKDPDASSSVDLDFE